MAFDRALVADSLEAGLNEICKTWKGNVLRHWKCVLENRSGQTLIALGTTTISGSLATVLPDIPPGKTGMFVWEKTRGTATGAVGIVHYQYDNKVLNLMASIPFDWNIFDAWCNARVSNEKETFYNMYNGYGGCAHPIRAGNWGNINGTRIFLTAKSHAQFHIYFDG